MEWRAAELHSDAVGQVDDLIELAARLDDAELRRPCPGREKLGDGSVGTVLAHTAGNYLRIGELLAAAEPLAAPQSRSFLRRLPGLGHFAGTHRRHSRRDHGHNDASADCGADVAELRDRLATARGEMDRIADLDDRRLDSIPPAGAFRFCDGKRSLAEVLAALLAHQAHQVQALASS